MAIFIADKTTGIIEDILMFDSLTDAEAMFQNKLCVERTESNHHLEVGDVIAAV